MKIFLTFILLLSSLSSLSGELKLDHKMIEEGRFLGDQLKDGERYIFVWPSTIVSDIKEKDYNEKLRNGKFEPYITFKPRVDNIYKKFNKMAERFNSCTASKKWPEARECLKEFKYCFGGDDPYCNAYRTNEISKYCKLTKLDKCFRENEKAFNFLKNCFKKDNNMGFRFLTYEAKGGWEDAVGVRSTGTDRLSKWTCDFTYLDGEFNLIKIHPGGDYSNGVEVLIPRANRRAPK